MNTWKRLDDIIEDGDIKRKDLAKMIGVQGYDMGCKGSKAQLYS